MVGRRWDTDITEAIDFEGPDWSRAIKTLAKDRGVQQPGYSIDYSLFAVAFTHPFRRL